jgi:hypothetical protein
VAIETTKQKFASAAKTRVKNSTGAEEIQDKATDRLENEIYNRAWTLHLTSCFWAHEDSTTESSS